MAELGSHQLDAASIFIRAQYARAGDPSKMPHPLSVAASGNRPIFPVDRDIEDHVYCIFEFPAPGYDPKDANARRKKIGVQYASINGNGYGGYGETVFGTAGTLILERELDVMLFKREQLEKTKITAKSDGRATLELAADGDKASAAIGQMAMLEAERGYVEELEHWASCIRHPDPANRPHCHPEVAMGDAIVALVSNMAAREGRRIEFNEAWFDPQSDETPEGVKPDLGRYA
jgi:predicted dehydrogenase